MKICSTCGICCRNTEMELSFADIDRIESTNPFHWTRNKFYESHDDYYILKNENGYCIFLNPENNDCKIYENRPQGCRFYPMLFDPQNNQCVLDTDCPHRQLFYGYKAEYHNICKKVRKWYNSELLPSRILKK